MLQFATTAVKRLPQRQSLVAQTLAVLKVEIQSGAWPHGLPAERKLCEQLMVSRGTLRAALACLKREHWLRARQGSRWTLIRSRSHRRTKAAGKNLILLTPQPLQMLTPLSIFWIDNLREHLGEAGYHLDVRHDRACFAAKPERALEELAQHADPAGWVLRGSTAAMQRWFSRRGMPCVIAGSRHAGVNIPTVDLDLPAACRHAAGQFLTKGYRRLVLLNPQSGLAGDIDCEKSFQDAATRRGARDVEVIIARHDGTRESVCRRVNTLLRSGSTPVGFLVSGPKFTLTALGLLLNHSLRLPQQAALISRDDDTYLHFVVPSVARYSTDPTLFARKVSRTVLRLVQGGAIPPQDVRLIPRFVSGETFS